MGNNAKKLRELIEKESRCGAIDTEGLNVRIGGNEVVRAIIWNNEVALKVWIDNPDGDKSEFSHKIYWENDYSAVSAEEFDAACADIVKLY